MCTSASSSAIKLNKSASFMQTPTKGGASVCCLNMAPSTQTSAISTQSPIKNSNRKFSFDQLLIDETLKDQKIKEDEFILKPVFNNNYNLPKITEIKSLSEPKLTRKCFIHLHRIDITKLINGNSLLVKEGTEIPIEKPRPRLIVKIIRKPTPPVELTQMKAPEAPKTRSTELQRLQISTNQTCVRKLRAKSKTFPNLLAPVAVDEPLDVITVVKPINAPLATTRGTRRSNKLRTLSATNLVEDSSLVQSPAELLRKYSSVKGHTCEMDKLFKGSSVTVTQCLTCENLKKLPEAFYDRSLPVNMESKSSMDFEWILKCLKNESYLNEDSKYMCDKCTSKQEAKIHTQYNQMPNILILHLLSYGITTNDGVLNTQKLNSRSKLATSFDCICDECTNDKSKVTCRKSNLKSDNYVKHVFRLYAVVMHSGLSLNSGHYTAFINSQTINENSFGKELFKQEDNEMEVTSTPNGQVQTNSEDSPHWLHFDDSKVKLISNTEFHRKIIDSNYDSPYILFYVKHSLKSTEI